jgi:hypothetical protein
MDPGSGEAGRFETRLGATIVCLLFLGLALNMWPGWTRIAQWTHQTFSAPASST